MANNNETVLILLSLYNGERYIREQLDSLLRQTVPVYILIRDDGSTDQSVSIVKEYCNIYSNIRLFQGTNKGYVSSFNILISNEIVDLFKWIAFCDQDDVWLSNKLEMALKKINEIGKEYTRPIVYCSNLLMVDDLLNPIGLMYDNNLKWSLKTLIVQNPGTGCSMVFNNKAVKCYRMGINKVMASHDYTMTMIGAYLGHLVVDHNAYIMYRQHCNNTIGGENKKIINGIKDIIRDLVLGNPELRVQWFRVFYQTYGKKLSVEQREILKTAFLYKRNMKYRFDLVFSPKYVGYDAKTTLGFKVRALIGRLY